MKESWDDDLWLALKSRLSNLTHNWDQKRIYRPSLWERTEGFTEKWGEGSPPRSDKWSNSDLAWDEASSLQGALDPSYPQQSITLFQFHPAWEEQLALRVTGLPFVVVNSEYAVWEAAGPLPCLRVLPAPESLQNDLVEHPSPALVGRTAPDRPQDRNCILNFLQQLSGLAWNRELVDDSRRRTAQLFVQLIEGTLEPCWVSLNYDELAQKQVHWSQSMQASGGSRWQVWCDRIHSLRRLGSQQKRWDIKEALLRARQAYDLLEQHLVCGASSNQTSFMGTDAPVFVDFLLWGHLARALSNVHLVMVLADFPALCRYAQRIWDAYFGDVRTDSAEWMRWNTLENARNAFCQLPLVDRPDDASKQVFHHTLELMEKLSLQNRDLREHLVILQQSRLEHEPLCQINRETSSTWHRWFVGNPVRLQSTKSTSTGASPRPDHPSARDQEDKSKREYQRNDELWITTVIVGTGASLLLFGLAG